ncbi:nicotinamide riboside transporter PnuC [Weissella confusa]|uniref:nicotinamide riboside transporter PnuC n=1 Tax=Weissella confusa TaxID=1583 RepID=UPI0021AFC6EA|nr:nicotinamide riboside transporter PnuC [Weissella confusa]MCS9991221.1 nicotinamide mononucleotide transporter [Weissella confusa]
MTERAAIFEVLNPKWYVNQMKGWSQSSYMLLTFGIGFIVSQTLANPITSIALWTMIAAVLGFTTTLSITNAKPLNGLFGLLSAIVYIGLAIKAGNPADAILQGVYILLLDLPVLFIAGWSGDVSGKVRKISEVKVRGEKPAWYKNYWFFGLVFVVSYLALYFFEIYITHSPRPLIDAGTAAIGITGATLTTLRFSESYYLWFLQGLAQIILWGMTAMQGDASLVLFFTYMLYMANDVLAFTASPWFTKRV